MTETGNRITITVQNRTADGDKLHEYLGGFVRTNNIPDETYNDLRLVAEEVFINIINYAHNDNASHPVSIELDVTADIISMTFTDAGNAFNPLAHGDYTISTDDHCEGGMGIHLIKSLTDSQRYQRTNGRNVFTVTKHYTKKK